MTDSSLGNNGKKIVREHKEEDQEGCGPWKVVGKI